MASDDFFDDIPDSEFIQAATRIEANLTTRSRPPPQHQPSSAARPIQPTPRPIPSTTIPNKPPIIQPTPRPLPAKFSSTTIKISPTQRANKLLKSLTLTYELGPETQLADYVISPKICALFLSLKYHRLHPEYIYGRVKALGPVGGGEGFTIRLLLCLMDIDAPEAHIADLSRMCFQMGWTMLLAPSTASCARYIEDYKRLEGSVPKSIMGREKKGYDDCAKEFIQVVRGVNKEDAHALLAELGSVRAAVEADEERLLGVGGWGEVKVGRWVRAVTEPFRPGYVAGKRAVLPVEDLVVDEDAEEVLREAEMAAVARREEESRKRMRKDSVEAGEGAVVSDSASGPAAGSSSGGGGEGTEGIFAALERIRQKEGA